MRALPVSLRYINSKQSWAAWSARHSETPKDAFVRDLRSYYNRIFERAASKPSMARTPSLGRSDESSFDSNSTPATPAMSPFLNSEMYSLPPIDSMTLPHRMETPQLAMHAALPDIMDPNTAANVSIRHICCIGAGYVGEFET